MESLTQTIPQRRPVSKRRTLADGLLAVAAAIDANTAAIEGFRRAAHGLNHEAKAVEADRLAAIRDSNINGTYRD